MKKLTLTFVFALAASFVFAQNAQKRTDGYKGYEGLVLGGNTSHSTTDAIAKQVTQDPGDIYRGTVFGAEQKKYEGDTLGTRPKATTKYVYDTSLVRAIKINDPDRVRTLMYANVDVNEKNYAGITPLTFAAEKGNMEIIKMLVEDGKAYVNEPSSYGVTPLIAAAAAGNVEAASYLIAHGADASAKDDWGKTALIYAANAENPKLLASVIKLDNKAVNLPDNSGNTALIYAAQKGFANHAKILLANGANPDYRNPATGLSALSAAAAEGHSSVIRLLAHTGKADINISDLSGRTPIFYAVEQNQVDALRALVSLGANTNAQDNNGVTALMRAAAKNRQDCVDNLLRQKGIDPNLKDLQDRTALIYSVYAEDLEPAKSLLKAGADLNLADSTQNTPLMSAIKAKNDRMALYFIQQGADLTRSNTAGENAFILVEEYLPNSMTANVLGIKKAEAYQNALQIQAQKLAEVRTLELQLSQEEELVQQLQAEKQAQEQAAAQAKEAALRAQLEEEYKAKAASELANDPELIRLQQQLEAVKAQREAAAQEEIDRQVAEQLQKNLPETTPVSTASK